MTASIQLVYSPSEDLTSLSNLTFSAPGSTSLAALTRDDLQALLKESDADYIGFLEVDHSIPETFFQGLNDLSPEGTPGIVLVPFNKNSPFIGTWETLPPQAATLSANPLQHAAVLISREKLAQLTNLDAPADRIWQAVILLVQSGVEAALMQTDLPPVASGIPEELPALAPDYPASDRSWLLQLLRSYEPTQDLPVIGSKADAAALKAGLLCIHDYLDESHEYSQSVQSRGVHVAGDYWHHIMHRREPDYSNAKYWSRAVGYHPLHDLLPRVVESLLGGAGTEVVAGWKSRLLSGDRWNLNTFVDCCAEAEKSGNPELNKYAQSIQWIEMQLLLQQTSRDAATS